MVKPHSFVKKEKKNVHVGPTYDELGFVFLRFFVLNNYEVLLGTFNFKKGNIGWVGAYCLHEKVDVFDDVAFFSGLEETDTIRLKSYQ